MKNRMPKLELVVALYFLSYVPNVILTRLATISTAASKIFPVCPACSDPRMSVASELVMARGGEAPS